MFIPPSVGTRLNTENRNCTHVYSNKSADLRVDDARISARVAHTFSPATVPVVCFVCF
jgi:hypothetical protein